MLHPLFSTLIQRPDLVADHVSGYAALIRHEAGAAGMEVLVKAVAWVVTGISVLVFVLLAGTALMLGFINHEFNWILVVVPAVPLLMGIAAFIMAKKPFKSEHFPELRAQLDSDTRALQMVA